MRCPVCGTQNEPDSRFCGGCGARVNGTESRLAPTEKINSDAPLAVPPTGSIPPGQRFAPSGGLAGVDGGRRLSAPPEMPAPAAQAQIPMTKPGTAAAPARPSGLQVHPGNPVAPGMSTRPGAGPSVPPRASTPAPLQAAPAGSGGQQPRTSGTRDVSMVSPAPRTRWGLVIFLLLLDVGLAGSGGWMLWQGLRTADYEAPAAPKATPAAAAAPAVKTGAVVTPVTPVAAKVAVVVPPDAAIDAAPGSGSTVVATDSGSGSAAPSADDQANEKAKLDAIANDSSPAADTPAAGSGSASTIGLEPAKKVVTIDKKKKKPTTATKTAKDSKSAADGPVDPYGEKP